MTRRTRRRRGDAGGRPRCSVLAAAGCIAVMLGAGCTATDAAEGASSLSAPSSVSTVSATESDGGTSPAAGPPSTSGSSRSSCAVTQPTVDGIPRVVREQRPGDVFGRGGLWVSAWWTNPDALGQAQWNRGQKYATWVVRTGQVTDQGGPPRITVKRLDGPGHGSGSTGGFATATVAGAVAHWWPTVVRFSGSGCWQVTETVGDAGITYSVEI